MLIVSFEIPLPEPMLKKLDEFRKNRGVILANRPLAGAWLPEGAVDLGQLFAKSHADFECNNDFQRHVMLEEKEGREQAAKLVQAIGAAVVPLADCDDPTTWLSVHQCADAAPVEMGGQGASYVWAVNAKRLPQRPIDFHRYSAFEHTCCPTKTRIRLKAGNYAIYDVFAGRRVQPEMKDGQAIVTADMTLLPGALFALLPKPIEAVRISTGVVRGGSGITLRASVADVNGGGVPATIPLEIMLIDARGAVRYHVWRTAVYSKWQETLPLRLNDEKGKWTVVVTELLSGRGAKGEVQVNEVPAAARANVASPVEWFRAAEAGKALASAKTVAILTTDKQHDKLTAVFDRLAKALSSKGMQVGRLSTAEYLKDRLEFGWDKFVFAGAYQKELRARPRKFDLIFTLDTPELPSTEIYAKELRSVEPSASDPGLGRAMVQYVVMPVYDTEDAIAISGGDEAGLLAGIDALAGGVPVASALLSDATLPRSLPVVAESVALNPIRQVLGSPVRELAVSADGQRILAGLMSWGNNLITLSGDGQIVSAMVGGKHFPIQLSAGDSGFTAHMLENDSIVNYTMLMSRDGKPLTRLASSGRQIGGTRDASARYYDLWKQGLSSVTPDGRLAAIEGSRGIAVWDVPAGKVLWRDDALVHDKGGFAQVKLSSDGKSLAVLHDGKLFFRDARTGQVQSTRSFPVGTRLGEMRMYEGGTLIFGDTELFAFRDGQPLWHWSTPAEVTATAFARDGLHWCVGSPDGAIKLNNGSAQVAGHKTPSGAISSLAMSADGSFTAFGSTTGWVGVVDLAGKCRWQKCVSTRAAVALAGSDGSIIAGDWRGFVRRFDPQGKQLWEVDLTPRVYRDDLAAVLTTPDSTLTLRLPAPKVPVAEPPQGKANLATKATVKHVPAPAAAGGTRSSLRRAAALSSTMARRMTSRCRGSTTTP